MNRKILSLLVLLFAAVSTFAQDTIEQNVYNEKYKFTSLLKSRFMTSTETGDMRFEIRNARVEMKGRMNQYVGYNLQVDLSDRGTFKVLDLAAKFFPTPDIDISIGQVAIPYATYKVTSPFQVLCSDLPFTTGIVGPQPRDIGMNIGYVNNSLGFPIFLQGGIYNGNMINQPRTESTLAYSLRAGFGDIKKFRVGAKLYNANNYANTLTDITSFGFDANTNFLDGRLTFDLEWDCRYTDSTNHNPGAVPDMYATYAELAYKYDLKGKNLHYIMPIVKWDMLSYEKLEFDNINKVTFALNFGFNEAFRKTEVRLNYEKYFYGDGLMQAQKDNKVNEFYWQDKFILEVLLRF